VPRRRIFPKQFRANVLIGRRFPRQLQAGLVAALIITTVTVGSNPAQAQVNALAVAAGPAFPSSVQVGQQNQPGLIAVTNNSVGNLATQPVTITNIRLNPSCANSFSGSGNEPCTQPDSRSLPGPILGMDAIATGRPGTACAGILFAVSAPNANGTVTFTPTSPVVLAPVTTGGPTTTCLIDFTFDVLQRPLDGSTSAVLFVDAVVPNPSPPPSSIPAFNIPGTSSIIVVGEAPTTIVTQASPQTLQEGGIFGDTATVTGVPGGPPLTSSVVFTLYRSAPGSPGFPTCTAGEMVTSSVVQVVPGSAAPNGAPRATATFVPTPAQPPGRYAFVASYDRPGGPNPDVNHLSSTSPCADPNEQVTVVPALPSIALDVTANPTSVVAPGGPVTFTVRVTNTGSRDVTLTSLTDDVYGDLNGQGTCVVAPPGSVPPTTPLLTANGGSYTCTYTGVVQGTGGQSQTNHVSASADIPGAQTTVIDDATVTITGAPGSRYTPLSPVRIEDTRTGAGGLSGPVGSGATVEVQITGRGGVPAGASAVVLNVTVTQPTAEGYLTMYPVGSPRPLAANVNFTPAKTVPNLVVVKVGTNGRVAMFNSNGATHVIYDVAGYYLEGAGGNAGRYQPLVPARIADTRSSIGGVRLGPGQSFDLQVSGRGGAPVSGISAAVLNVAATNTTATSYLTVYPTGEARPLAANLNFTAGDTVSNRTMTKLGTAGRVTIYNNAGDTDVVVDLGGTYTDASVAGTLGAYTPLEPARILDTRSGAAIPAGGTVEVQVTGQGGVPPTGVRAVILSVAVTQPAGSGYLTIFPSGAARPLASDLNYATGETRANLVVVQVGANGKVGLFSSTQAHVVFDVAGWFT